MKIHSKTGLCSSGLKPQNSTFKIKCLIALVCTGLGGSALQAQTNGTWVVDANGNWSDSTNWSSDPAVPGGAGSIIDLTADISGNRTITVDDTDRTVGILNIGDPNASHTYTLKGSGGASLIFDNNGSGAQINMPSTARGNQSFNSDLGIVLNDSLTVTNDDNQSMYITSSISGTGDLTLSGTGTGSILLSGSSSSFVGNIIIDRTGTSQFNSNTAFGDEENDVLIKNGSQLQLNGPMVLSPSRNFTLSNGGIVAVSNGNNNTNAVNLSGVISGDGGLATGSNSHAVLLLSNHNTFTDGLTVSSGLLRFGDKAALGVDKDITADGGGFSFLGTEISNLSDYSFTINSNRTMLFEVLDPTHTFTWDKDYDTNMNAAGGTTFIKAGRGELLITTMQTYRNVQQTGTTTSLEGGTMTIDYAAGGGLRGYEDGAGVADDNTLRFGGGTLHFKGKGGVDDVIQNTGDVKLAQGGGTIVVDNQSGSGATTVNFGSLGTFATINPEMGSSLNIRTINAGTGSAIATTTDSNTNGIVGGGRVTLNGSDWATNTDPGGSNVIGAYSAYTALPSSGASATDNALLTGSGSVTDDQHVNTLKITGADGDALAISAGKTLGIQSSGLLYTGGASASDNYSITGGTISANDLVVHQQGLGSLTIDSDITDFAADQSATTTSGSKVITGLTSTADLIAGQSVTGTSGIPSNRIIQSIDSATQITLNANANATGASTLSFASNLTKTGDGELILTSANSFTGNTYINGGVLSVSADNQLGATTDATLALNGGTLKVTSGFSTDRDVTVDGNGGTFDIANGETFAISKTIYGNRGAVILDNSDGGNGVLELNKNNRFNGGVQINQGILRLGDDNAIGQGGANPLDFGNGSVATLQINGARDVTVAGLNSANSNAVVENAGSGDATLRVYNGHDNSYAGTLRDGASGTLGLVKGGSGSLSLTGTNSYTGATDVIDGTLLINGSLASSSLSVESGATLGGSGSISGDVTILSGGSISPGTSPGTLTLNDNLTLTDGATLTFEAGDFITVGGILDLQDNWTLSLQSGFADGGSTTLFSYGSLAGGVDLAPTFDTSNLGFSPSGALTLSDTGSSIILNGVSVIPEPSTGVMLLIAITTGCLFMRRQRKRS
ncbi:autotransporter-associated beta strand repeat-containing protein [Kiritimatiellota bacterium B12222]|nr:autotransporter-associated beta strand repeat-containing protein [Kiritimatiellota bacterium B12222]